MMETYKTDILKAAASDLPWELLQGKNILVTGATGLIGSCVVEILMSRGCDDYTVYASGRNPERIKSRFEKYNGRKNFQVICHDVTCPLECNIDFHYIISAASGANPVLYSTDPIGVMKANIMGTENLLSYGIGHNLKKFVYISSGDVYGQGDGRIFTEDYSGYVDPLDIRSSYTSSKRAAETLCISYAHQHNIEVCIARPCHVYGPHYTESDTRAYAQFINNAIAGHDIVMKSHGEQFRSWCYVVDAAIGILYVMLKGENCNAYNIADEKSNITIHEFAEIIADICGTKIIFDIPTEAESKGFNRVNKSVFSTAKLSGLGWSIAGSINNKIRRTIMELKAQNNNDVYNI